MIQRIQTVYMFMAAVACVLGMSMGIGRFYSEDGEALARFYNLWITFPDGHHLLSPWALFVILLVSATLLLFNIFLYKHRVRQLRLCVFCQLLQVGWYAAYGFFMWMQTKELHAHFRPEWPAAMPLVAVVLIWLAMRGITRDELRVRSLDRLR